MIDISELEQKRNNDAQADAAADIPKEEKLSAEEFVSKIVAPIIELQKDSETNVKELMMGNVSLKPKNGVVILPSTEGLVAIISQGETDMLVTDGKVTLSFIITSTESGQDTNETVNVNVERFVNGSWSILDSFVMSTKSATSTTYDTLDISDLIADGEHQIRLSATGTETNKTGRLTYTITKSTLKVECLTTFSNPFTDGKVDLSYSISGVSVDKTLYIKAYDNTNKEFRLITQAIGTATFPANSPKVVSISDAPTDSVKVITHGVHKFETWISCVGKDGKVYESEHVYNQAMVVTDSADTTPYLMLQNVVREVDNYVFVSPLFKYAVYNPSNTDYYYSFIIGDYDQTVEYMSIETNNGTGAIDGTISIENAVLGSEAYAYLRVFRIKREGGEITEKEDFLYSSVGEHSIDIKVRNDQDFAPTAGADFFINPKIRNNSEVQPDTILNAAKNNSLVPSSWEGFNHVNDGWVTAEDGEMVLRILANQKLTIQYDPFSRLASNPNNSMSLELDFKVRNVTTEEDAIIAILNTVAATGKFIGLKMMPLEGVVMTASKTTEGEQNFAWREGYRTHVVINILNALHVDNSGTTIPLVRVFINAVPNREFLFVTDQTSEWRGNFEIAIGQSGADIDIYALRCYQGALSAKDIMQNYKSSLPTSAEKVAFASANDILGGDGSISFDKARQKYSCIVHHGTPPSRIGGNMDSTTCWLEIVHFVNGVYDPSTSGTICKDTKMCPVKGQGTTAMNYAYWNQQYDPKKAALPDSDTTTLYINKESDGKTTRLPAIMVGEEKKQDGWIDGNGNYKGTYYQLATSDARAEKLVGKINYASSMQSHKMGATSAYNDLYRHILSSSNSLDSLMQSNQSARCAVKEDMFFFFVQEDGESEPHYEGIMTFGAGKMDTKAWGVNDDALAKGFAMFEGADNDQPLANFQIPWTEEEVTYDPTSKIESFMYKGKKQIGFSKGDVYKDANGKEIPRGIGLGKMKAFANFAYLYCSDIKPWSSNGGTASSLKASTTADTNYQYWITAEEGRGDLYRWDYISESWVMAGLAKTDGEWQKRNVFSENPDVSFDAQYDRCNEALRLNIAKRFKDAAPSVINVESHLFHSCFVQNLLAGSDNCAKNTYYVIDPVTLLVCLHADDLDTIFKTDNVGWQTKPYYVDREYHIDDQGVETYSGTHNAFFNTFDLAYANEKRSMMKRIFTAMASIAGSVDKFMERYFFSVQRSIPTVAYQEQARVRYEIAQLRVNAGTLSLDTVAPITQQLGDQLQSELQYMDRRMVYFQSYAAYGEWDTSGANGFGSRGTAKRDGTPARIEFTVKPHQYLYPTGSYGSSIIDPHVRVAPNQQFKILLASDCSSDTTFSLHGINYYRSIGNIGDVSFSPNYGLTVSGARLVEFVAIPSSGEGEFRPSSLTFACPLVERVAIKCADVGANLNMSGMTRAKTIDLHNANSVTQVQLPNTPLLQELHLPSKLTDLSIERKESLTAFSIQSTDYLLNTTITQSADIVAHEILSKL